MNSDMNHFCNLADPGVLAALLHDACRHRWVLYSKPPFGGPEHVLQYLGNYTHRIAISNQRLAPCRTA
jgi:hypothetical protein